MSITKKNRCILLAIVIFISVSKSLQSQEKWEQKEIVLGVFYDPPIDIYRKSIERDINRFKLVKECKFNLLTGIQGDYGIDHSFEGMNYALEIASKVGLRYLVTDNRIYEAYAHAPKQGISKVIAKDYKTLPENLQKAMVGFNICDEPNYTKNHMENVRKWKTMLDSDFPEKLIYYNLAPSYAVDNNWGGFKSGNKNNVLDLREKNEYENYLSFYIDSLNPCVVSFDHYPFFKDGTIRRDYFYNLEIMKLKSGNRPFWAIPMVVDHLSYIDPTPEHLRFMFFCPIAYGAKGLVIFTFWPPENKDYRTALVDINGNKTFKYNVVKEINTFIIRVLSPVINKYKCLEVLHSSDIPQNQVFLSTNKLNSSLILEKMDKRLLVGVFGQTFPTHLIIVNKTLERINNAVITLKGIFNLIEVNNNCIGIDDNTLILYKELDKKNQNNNTHSYLPSMEGGECIVLRFSK